jgi:hypothetical protein
MTGDTVTTGSEGVVEDSYRTPGVYRTADGAHETRARCGNR